ncbi:hypothetical protein OG883_40810 [Streptomyces sp. NBC_01142]|uniref:hypothetical protein n=1 Tax=Streptomyces sp. NBC_01142 TaxID=2975865 RepID=UPI00224E2ABE|nr:hypothetical protein [Streptomyces sp. NBC_01142]MCX4826018.1 hypothetical protein [Streptomyces sp. NBC_01142]
MQDHILRALRAGSPRTRTSVLRAQAAAWARLGTWPQETEAWIRALGADGTGLAATCRRLGVGLAAMDIMLDGQYASRRLRGGESVTAVQARAAALGITLPT